MFSSFPVPGVYFHKTHAQTTPSASPKKFKLSQEEEDEEEEEDVEGLKDYFLNNILKNSSTLKVVRFFLLILLGSSF